MKLLRLAVLSCDPRPNSWEAFGIKADDVEIGMGTLPSSPTEANILHVLIKAETTLPGLPPRDGDGYITIPNASRRRCEELIEFVANLIAVAGRCKRSISSPDPPAALVAEGLAEQQFLDESAGVRLAPVSRTGANLIITLHENLFIALADRTEGLSVMAEALAHSQALGEYRDLVRVLELAFALPVTQLEKKLATFLAGAGSGYLRPEIAHWISLRHGASHADKQTTKTIVLEADVRPIIMRMEQAVMDVLFNKKTWHDKSTDRRELLRPNVATTSANGGLRLTRGQPAQFLVQTFDEFGVYPYLMKNVLAPRAEWWWKPLKTPLSSGTLQVVDAIGAK